MQKLPFLLCKGVWGEEFILHALHLELLKEPSKEWWLRRRRRAERSYFTFKVRRGSDEKILLAQGKE